jgi:hypothetical protein
MKENNTSHTKESIFPVIVAGLSLFNIYNHLTDFLSLSTLLSLIGIAGTILYFKKNDLFKKLMYLWIIAQLIVIDREILDTVSDTWYESSFWDLTQVFSFKLGFTFATNSNKFGFNLNVIAIVYLAFFKILEISSLAGKQLTFYKFKPNSNLSEVFPLTGTIKKRVVLSKDKDWLLVELTSPFNFNGKSVNNVLIKRKDGEVIKPKVKNQLVFFRLIYDINQLVEGDNESNNFPFVDWAICE